MNVREALEDFVMDHLIGGGFLDSLNYLCPWVEIVEPEGNNKFPTSILRFEVLVDDGDEDLLVVADGEIDWQFNLILNILED
jgi:hypothetical protein